jgi:molecular chaperone GrpE
VPPTPPPAGDAQQADAVERDLDALLAEAEQQRDEYLDLAKRTKADFENFRKRMTAEVQAATTRGKASLVGELVGVIDNLERALDAADIDPNGPVIEPDGALAQGILLTYRHLCEALERAGVQPFDPTGEKFDPTWHEALSMKPAEGTEAGVVVEVMQKGYRLDDQLIRPARVVVTN